MSAHVAPNDGRSNSGGAAAGAIDGRAPRLSMNWIVSRPVDLSCFIGAAALGYGMFYLHAGLAMNMVTVWLVWYMFLDSPHFFGTYSRTYLDREEMASRRRLLLGSLWLLAVGPAFIAGSWLLHVAGIAWYKTPFLVLVAFVSIWAYWHVVRQHFGIMSLYKRKNNDSAVLDRRLDQWFLYIGLLAPFVAFAVTNNGARAALGLSAELDGGAYANVYAPGGWEETVVRCTMIAAAAACILFVARQIQRWWSGERLNAAKYLFLLAVIPLHMVVCYHPASTTLHLLGFSACVTIFHDVQYHTIVWYYQKNRVAKAGDAARARYGFASRIGRSFPLYVICAVGMGLMLGLLGCLLSVNPGCIPVLPSRETFLFGAVTLEELLYGVFLGVLMHHYFVDQFIWRPSRDAGVSANLKLAERPA